MTGSPELSDFKVLIFNFYFLDQGHSTDKFYAKYFTQNVWSKKTISDEEHNL